MSDGDLRGVLLTHGVEPGTFTNDREANAVRLARLRTFVERYPQVRVHVGHEL